MALNLTWLGYIYILHEHYLVGEMDLGQAVQDCTLIWLYDQLFELHCTAD